MVWLLSFCCWVDAPKLERTLLIYRNTGVFCCMASFSAWRWCMLSSKRSCWKCFYLTIVGHCSPQMFNVVRWCKLPELPRHLLMFISRMEKRNSKLCLKGYIITPWQLDRWQRYSRNYCYDAVKVYNVKSAWVISLNFYFLDYTALRFTTSNMSK